MKATKLPIPLRGIIPPMITPLVDRDTLDVAGLERLVEHILAGGVHGLFILGTTGEAPSLSYRLRQELIDRVCRQVNGRVPVLVGVTDTSFVESVNLANHAASAGAQAVVLSAPYYFPAGQAELIEYIEDIAAELPVPVFLYNMPSHTKLVFEPETVRRARHSQHRGHQGQLGANHLLSQVHQMTAGRGDFSLLVGPEELLGESVLSGAHGGVCGGANLFPRLYVDLYEAASAAQLDRIAVLHAHVMRLGETIYAVGKHRSAFIKGLKCIVVLWKSATTSWPSRSNGSRRQAKQIAGYLAELGVSPQRPALQTR